MLLEIDKHEILDWKGGKFTPKVDHKGIYPRTQKPIPISVASGGSINSLFGLRVRFTNSLCNYRRQSVRL